MTEQSTNILAPDGIAIPATFTAIPNAERAVLFLHGITVNRDEYQGFHKQAANYLATKNVNSLRIDFRGHGESCTPQTDFDVISQVIDTNAAIKWMADRWDLGKFGIIATSFGSPPAVFASLNNLKVDRLCLLAPVLDYRRTFLEPETEWARASFNDAAMRKSLAKGYLLLDGGFKIGIRLLEEMRLLDPTAALRRTLATVKIIHGNRDTMVPFATSIAAKEICPQITLIEVPNMDHGYADINDPTGNAPRSIENKKNIFEEFAEIALRK